MSLRKLRSFKLVPENIRKPLDRFIETESASGIVLAICTVAAMLFANSSFSAAYFHFFEIKLLGLTLHHWINDGLMTIFFFVVGMEIKREIVAGELSTLKKAALPIAAAVGGMIAPAFIYWLLNKGTAGAHGWAIPMATDIAFALAVLTLFGARVPLALKIFLLALAIVDDLGAVIVIAVFYTEEIRVVGLAGLAASMAIIILARTLRLTSYFLYVFIGILAWGATLYSGIHATIAGVLVGLVTPFVIYTDKKELNNYSPLNDLIHKLHPWVGFVIMPVFALANAGISLQGVDYNSLLNNSIFSGVWIGLFVGKPLGIFAFSLIVVKLGLATMPRGLRWQHLAGVSILGGIGFTMALFISSLSLDFGHMIFAKAAVLFGSLLAGVVGFLWLKFFLRDDIYE